MENEVKCAECGKTMSYINNRHLASHGLTSTDYKTKFPNAPLRSEAVAKRQSENAVAINATRKGVARDENTKQKMRDAARKRREAGVKIVRGPMSEAQKQKLSDAAHERYANGFQHPNLGKHLPEETRNKISNTLTGRIVGPEIAYKAIETKRSKGYDLAPMRGKSHSPATKARIAQRSSATQRAQRTTVREHMLERIRSANLTLLNDLTADVFRLQCSACKYEFTRTPQCFQPSKFHLAICDQCHPISKTSKAEHEIADYIRSITNTRLIMSDAEQISPLELDILLPEQRLAIEYGGLFWHSELAGKHRWYHRHKLDACGNLDVRLLTIFEDEWLNTRSIAESMIRNALRLNDRTINARACSVRQINSDGTTFLKENHIQGGGRSNVKFGLIHDGELISVMSFSNGEISRRNPGWEVNRFCSKLGYSIRGGASKLFTAFLREFSPEKVTSYADLRWGTGAVYGHLGFEFVGNTVPNYWYIRANEMKRHHRYALRKQPHEPKDRTEWDIRKEEGWNRIWDCGHAKWVWSAEKTT